MTLLGCYFSFGFNWHFISLH